MKIGICAIIKDCYKPYLLEWLNHHISIGVDYFFIYDNESAIPIAEIIDPSFFKNIYIKIVSGKGIQMPVYDSCIADVKAGKLPACDWLAFIDEDEFIHCENGDIKKTLQEYAGYSGVAINWRVFGSSGIINKTPRPQREKFLSYTRPEYKQNLHIKSIVNPLLVSGAAGNPHAFNYISGCCVNVDKRPVYGPFSEPVYKKIWLDHYYTRSAEEWKEKINKGRADTALHERPFSLFDEVNANCIDRVKAAEIKTLRQIHLIMPFYRQELKEKLTAAYRPMNIIWHPIMFLDEWQKFHMPKSSDDLFIEDWRKPVIIPMHSKDCKTIPGNFKRNWFIKNEEIIDDDYYLTVDDDDMYEPGVFEKIKQMDEDIIIISMQRGYRIPLNIDPARRYPTSTLFAHPDYVEIGLISAQQCFVKGKIFEAHIFDENSRTWDGEIIIHHKKSGEQIRYEPHLYALFNYYEPGRWGKSKFAFGVLVNDLMRLDMVFRQSEIDPAVPCHTIKLPETATKGLNKLLGIMEAEENEIAILCHQDMFFRQGWLGQLAQKLGELPDSWIVAGIIGKDMQGKICGRLHDTRMPLPFNTKHEYPQPASCFDECCIIVNLKKGFRFDENMPGFDLYGTLCVLQAKENGGTAWIIDAFAEHYCMRSFEWYPGKDFEDCFKWIHQRFPNADRIDTTVIGVPEEKENKVA
jgi:hypothetical protein